MAKKNKKTEFRVTGNGVFVFYGFLTKKQYDRFLENGIGDRNVDDLVDYHAFSGALTSEMKVLVDKVHLEDLQEINQYYPLKTYPEKYPIPFSKSKKYALVSVEYENGDWVDSKINVKDQDSVVFEIKRYDLDSTQGLEFVITNVIHNGEELEQGELDQRNREFYLVNGEDWSVVQLKR
jgi:hypothetical protein